VRFRFTASAGIVLVLLLAWPAPSSAATNPEDAPTAPPILPLDQVHAGMRAVVRTVLRGDEIQELPAEVLGVMEKSLGPGQSLILLRINGETATYTGVAAGMSGSPVYVDGRLIGALSYRLGQFTKEAIAGVTPIQYMLDLARTPLATSEQRADLEPSSRAAQASISEPIPLVLPGGADSIGESSAGGDAAMVPIETPLVVTGVPTEILQHFLQPFRALGAVVVAGAGGIAPAGSASHDHPLRPGDAVAAQLVSGDLSVAATGTVTWVDGDKVLAFGHPFLVSGAAGFPMARAEIYLTLASLSSSTKLARITDTIGTWDQIRLPGISGVTSRVPRMIPLTVTVKSPGGTATYRYEVASHRDWSPNLVAVSVAGSLVNTPAFTDESTLSVSGRFHLEGHPDVILQDLYTGLGPTSSAAIAVASDIQGIFGAVFQNRFEAPRVTSIDLTAEGVEQSKVTFVEGVWPSKTEVKPGDEVQYHVRLRSYRGETVSRTFTFQVPETTPRGDLQVFIGGAGFLVSAERQMLSRQITGADDLDQIIGIVNRLRTSDALYAKVVRRLPGAVVQSEILPALPPSVLTTLRSNRGLGEVAPLTESTVWESKIPVPSIITGGTALTLKVR
jgi:hypothetical protein